MLLLTGPPGSGKSATFYALADEMNIDIKEWANPTAENTQRMNPDKYNGPGIKTCDLLSTSTLQDQL